MSLRFAAYTIPSATLGGENPLPDIQTERDLHSNIQYDENTITAEEARYMGWGKVNGILPYTIQDNYDRKKKDKQWKAAILENDYLKAVFLPELGGRLWTLVDKRTGKALLHQNPVFQPANLALRNAWFSGGVEWNIGIIGHHPYTCSPLHTEVVRMKDGTEVLRMYEYERVRGLSYRVEAALPEDSDKLIMHMRIENTEMKDTAVYWWSNIAVEEAPDVRVLVPAHKAFQFGYKAKLSKINVPDSGDGIDLSHSTNLDHAMDFFFDIPKAQRKWVATPDKTGYGLVQTSTDELISRKLFLWGMGPGGRNWQTFLAAPGRGYIEVQAGLAHTQLEHLPMKPGQVIEWCEAYGAIQIDGGVAQGKDWDAAIGAVDEQLEADFPRQKLEDWREKFGEIDGVKGERKLYGSGWGALEAERMKVQGQEFLSQGLDYSSKTLREAQKGWLKLLHEGELPCEDASKPPMSYQVSDAWMKLLTGSMDAGKSRHWYGYYQLGVMLAYRSRRQEALEAFEKSLSCQQNAWALRCKGVLLNLEGDKQAAADCLCQAVRMAPHRALAIEACRLLNDAGRPEDLLKLVDELPERLRRVGRVQALRADALLKLDKLDELNTILKRGIQLNDVREGEISLSELWFRMNCRRISLAEGIPDDEALRVRVEKECPPPAHLDFRMH
ncbi:MAG TPA: DUF5107 domain-containing protein [Candidatus Faecaligallichristensenella faecipullorum]|nr:DUF5107 domain-containing protein [Candidatus Faecaligallichristensenella faecipullorum]